MQHTSLSHLLQHRSSLDNQGILFIDASSQEEFLSYNALYDLSRRKLFSLQKAGLQQKNELVFQIECHKNFVITFWACILGGIIPVPLTIGQTHDHKQKLFNVWSFLNNPCLIISTENELKLRAFAVENGLQELYSKIAGNIIFEEIIEEFPQKYGMIHAAHKEDIAFVQFSSGSTGNAKGVMLTHHNLLTNMDAISRAAQYTQGDSMLSWMPLTHDMGLIGFHLNPLFVGMTQSLIPTQAFVRKPSLWLEKASEHKATILCSPNFGYKYVLKHCGDCQAKNLDLSSVRILYNGAEPISESICNEFLNYYSKFSLKRNAMCPVYGLAEASLAVSISNLNDEVLSISLDRDYLHKGDLIVANSELGKSVSFVNVGKPINNCAVRISHAGKTVKDGVVGEIQLKGQSVTKGYYNNAEATKSIITKDGWVKTGDLGFSKNGCLYITGRAKDVIFKNGKNYYSNDIEHIAEELEGIELNKIVVAGLINDTTKLDETIAFVFHRADLEKFLPIAMALNITVNSKLGFELDRIIPVKDIPRTTSGKLQRFKLVEQYKNGVFAEIEKKLEALSTTHIPPNFNAEAENDIHYKLLSIWKKVLKNDGVTVWDKFFEIGGNSLKAAEICMLVTNDFRVELPIQILFEKQTIHAVASVIESLSEKTYAPIPAVAMNYYPLASQQKGIFNFWQVNKASVAYNIPVAFRIGGVIDIDKLTRCIIDLIVRHESLRIFFPTMLDSPKFQIAESVDFSLVSMHCEFGELDQKLKEFVQPFDLSVAPLFRIKLIVVKSGDTILFADFHHIIADGLSIYNIVEELLMLYSGKMLPVLSTQYKDYASWEQGNQASPNISQQKDYWIQRLQDDLPVLEIPTDFVRPPLFDTVGKRLQFNLDTKTITSLKNLARQNNSTLHSVLFTAYCILLSKYTSQESLLVGIPASGRRHPDLKFVFGMFATNLPIKISLDHSKTFREMLELIKQSVAEALAHQEYPFDELVKAVSKKRNIGRNVLFDTMFMYQSLGPSVDNSEITLRRYFFDPGFSKYDLSFEFVEEADALSYEIEYSSQLFTEVSIKILAVHFNTLIEKILVDPGCTIANLSMVNATEYEEHVVKYNETKTPYPNYITVCDLFHQQAENNPQNIAITYQNRNIRYDELYHQVNVLSVFLRQHTCTHGWVGAVVLQRSPKFIISILAILKAGGCYLPIDPELPEDRIRYYISNSRCTYVIVEGSVKTLENYFTDTQFVNIDDIDLMAACQDVSFPVNPRDLAYIIYTSGTTGEPKGVMIEHRSLTNYTIWAANTYLNNKPSAFSFFTSVSFDLTVTSIFTPLITGNRIIVYKDSNAELLVEKVFAEDAAQVVKLTPSHLKIIAQSKLFETRKQCSVHTLIVGGEQLETSLALEIQEKFQTQIEIFNEYGPTEATVGCMIYKFTSRETTPSVPIGKPAANTQIYVLDKFLKPVATGSIGELYISGDGISRGYLHNASLTASKFLLNPFAKEKKMYKTGDLVKWLPDNNLAFVGRFDQQVKINGYRIELSEIENQLSNYPGISSQIVIVQTQRDQKQLLAYYQSMDVILESELRNYLSRKLPYYMIPSRFVHLEKIPLTRNGKINYEGLPSPSAYETNKYDVPLDDTTSISIDIWQDVLGEHNVKPTDNFFELGGDSIKAVQIASKLHERGIVVDVKDILVYQSIAEICSHTIRTHGNDYEQGIIEGEKKLSPTDLWFFDQMFENPNFYNQSVLLTLKRKVKIELLNQTFQQLVTHHDGLRLNYDSDRHTMFYNNFHLKNIFSVEDFTLAADNYGSDLIHFCHSLKSSFDIGKSLLIKAALIQGPNDDKLFITAHHFVVDGFSWRIFLEDFYTLYSALEAGSKFLKLSPKTASLRVWTNLYYERLDALRAQQSYWRKIDSAVFAIPQDVDTNDWTATNLAVVTRTLDAENTNYLMKDAHKVYDSDVLTLLNTALALTMNTWTGQEELVIEHENHGRHLEAVDASRTLGWFTAIYPVRLSLGKISLGDQILAIKRQLNDIPDHGLGYAASKYLKKGDGNWSRSSKLTEVRLNYLGQFDRELDNSLFTYSHDFHGNDVASNNMMTAKLEFNIMSVHGLLHIELKYNRKAYHESTARSLIDFYLNSLTTILEHVREERILNMSPKDFESVDLKAEEFNTLFK